MKGSIGPVFVFAASVACLLACPLEVVSAKKAAPKAEATGRSPITVNFQAIPTMMHPVRIGLSRKATQTRLAVWAQGALFIGNRPVFQLNPGLIYLATNGRLVELASGRAVALPHSERSYIAAADRRVWTNNRWYRGSLELINFGGAVTVINLLDMEEYLLGVVPSEMPASWHLEALKAQAVAARSYAWAHLGRGSKWYGSEGFDLVPDVRDQAYKGLAAEANSTYWAVQMTRGQVLADSGRVKPGFYRAWVGNAYENLNIRKAAIPNQVLEKITGVKNIQGVTVKQWDMNSNAVNIQVMGEKKTREVDGIVLARMLRLTTAGILDIQEVGSSWVFTYRGPGNGARGLSQHGANMLASRGWNYFQILQQYYQDPDGQLRLAYIPGYVRAVTARPANAQVENPN